MKTKFFVLLFISLFTHSVWALSEVSAEFGYGRQLYGQTNENKSITRSYSGSFAQYFFETSALEFNYSYEKEQIIENTVIPVTGTGYSVSSLENNVKTTVYGIGLRQALTGKKSPIRPVLSFGYAKQFVESWSDYTFRNDTTGNTFVSHGTVYKGRVDSAFAAFTLQIKMTETFSLQGSAKTIFPAFKTGQARNNLKYTAGFSWFF